MKNVTLRFTDGLIYAAMEDSELEGVGDTISEALRDLAEVIETTTI